MAEQAQTLDPKDKEIRRLRKELHDMTRLNADLQDRNRELERRMSEVFTIAVGVAK